MQTPVESPSFPLGSYTNITSVFHAADLCAVAKYLLPCLIVIYLFNLISGYQSYRKLKSSGLSIPSIKYLRKIFSLSSLFDSSYQRICFGLISLYLLYCGIRSSLVNEDVSYFARAGALITVAGLSLSLLEDRYVDRFKLDILKLSSDPKFREAFERKTQSQKRSSLLWVYFITLGGTILWAYGDVFFKRVVDAQSSAPSVPSPVESKPESWSRIFTASISEAELQRLMSAFENVLRDLRSSNNSPPVAAQDTQDIVKSLNRIETDLKKIASEIAGIPASDLSQRSPSSTPTSRPSHSK